MSQENIVKEAVIYYSFEGIDGNAFALMGHWRKCAQSQGTAADKISEVLEIAKAGDYDHLLRVLIAHCKYKPFAIADNELDD